MPGIMPGMADGGVPIVVVRHGEQERTGQDGPLTSRGRTQSAALADAIRLDGTDLLVCSTRVRARQTAEALGRDPLLVPDLDEFRFGERWTWEQADIRDDLALWRPEHRAGDESLAEFQSRVSGALDRLVAHPPRGRIVVCVHSGVIDALLRWALGIPPETAWTVEAHVPHASITEVRHWPWGRHPRGAPRHTLLVRVGDVAHLPPDLRTDVEA